MNHLEHIAAHLGELDAMLLTGESNCYYATGFMGEGVALVTRKGSWYFTDSRYTEAFVEDKIRFNQWGRRKIEQALYAKGVSADVYTPVLDRVPDSAYLEQLKPLLRAKWPTIKADSDYERSMKLIKFGMGRGYSLDLIRQCIDSVSEEDLDSDDELD